jgi:hypothetical protein
MEKMRSNKTNVAMQAVNLCPVNGLTRRNENSPEVEEDKMALSVFFAFSAFLELSAFSRTFEPRSSACSF